MGWQDKEQVKKGNIGELIVVNYLESKGYVVYKTETESAHPFDILAVKNKKDAFIAEVKTKAKMNKYAATGFDLKSYEEYKFLSEKYNLPVKCYFVDEGLKEVYGNDLLSLEEEYIDKDNIKYPNKTISKGIILFSLDKMKKIIDLTEDEVKEIKHHNTRNYNYDVN